MKREQDIQSEEQQPIIDEFGEELIVHKTKNIMNNMLPSISKDGVLGKRTSEVIKD